MQQEIGLGRLGLFLVAWFCILFDFVIESFVAVAMDNLEICLMSQGVVES